MLKRSILIFIFGLLPLMAQDNAVRALKELSAKGYLEDALIRLGQKKQKKLELKEVLEDPQMVEELEAELSQMYKNGEIPDVNLMNVTTDAKGPAISSEKMLTPDKKLSTPKESPEEKALQSYLQKKLREVFYGEKDLDNKPVKKIVDPVVFFEVMESQLGKTLLAHVANYCLNSDNNLKYPKDAAEQEKNRQANLKQLYQKGNFLQTTANEKFSKCLSVIPLIAKGKISSDTYTREMAQRVMYNIEELRNSIVSVQNTKKALLASENEKIGLQAQVNIAASVNEDRVTNLSTTEYLKATNDVEESDSNLMVKDEEKDTEKLNEKMGQDFFNTFLLKSKVEQLDEEGLKKLLMAEGRSEETVSEMLKNKSVEAIKAEYLAQLKAKKQVILSDNQAKIRGLLQKKSEPEKREDKQKQIADTLFYVNVVSGFMRLTNEGVTVEGEGPGSSEKNYIGNAYELKESYLDTPFGKRGLSDEESERAKKFLSDNQTERTRESSSIIYKPETFNDIWDSDVP